MLNVGPLDFCGFQESEFIPFANSPFKRKYIGESVPASFELYFILLNRVVLRETTISVE